MHRSLWSSFPQSYAINEYWLQWSMISMCQRPWRLFCWLFLEATLGPWHLCNLLDCKSPRVMLRHSNSQVHFNSKLGVLVEVNSETDFVALNLVPNYCHCRPCHLFSCSSMIFPNVQDSYINLVDFACSTAVIGQSPPQWLHDLRNDIFKEFAADVAMQAILPYFALEIVGGILSSALSYTLRFEEGIKQCMSN